MEEENNMEGIFKHEEEVLKNSALYSTSKPFNVFTMSSHNNRGYEHWAKGTTMIIEKDGVKMTLNSEELRQLVKTLPRTVGGRY